MRQSTREGLERAAKEENEEYFVRLRTPESKEALTAFLEKRSPNFNRATQATPGA
jgi:enoyl-CoA hydratase/carnithine racemase